MSQVVHRFSSASRVETLELPAPSTPVLGAIKWGKYTTPYTPAFWKAYTWLREEPESAAAPKFCHGNIKRETVLCLLGGYGIKAEVAYAYYNKLDEAGVIDASRPASYGRIRQLLISPAYKDGQRFRYRFPNMKARYLSEALRRFADETPPENDIELRDWLLEIPGIGRKTAGWVVRNCLGSDNVAIIDIHLHRAGRRIRLFDDRTLGSSTYTYFEDRFLQFARALEIKASILDLVIWEAARQFTLGSIRN